MKAGTLSMVHEGLYWRNHGEENTTTSAMKSLTSFSPHAVFTQRQRLMWTKQSKPASMQTGLILAGLGKYPIQNSCALKQPRTTKLSNGLLNEVPVDLYLTFFLRFLYENSGTKKEQTTQGIRFLYYNNILLINTITWTENPCVPGSIPGPGTSRFKRLEFQDSRRFIRFR